MADQAAPRNALNPDENACADGGPRCEQAMYHSARVNQHTIGSRAWLQALAPRGRLVLVEVALAAARAALPIWEATFGDVREPRETIEAIEAWLKDPTVARGRVLVELSYRRGDPDDIDGFWLIMDDGRVAGPHESDAYCAADYAGNVVYCPVNGIVDVAVAAIGCAHVVVHDRQELVDALARAAEVRRQVAYTEYGSLITRRPAPDERGVGKPDRTRQSSPCPACGGDGYPIGPKVLVDGIDHHPYRCDECDAGFAR